MPRRLELLLPLAFATLLIAVRLAAPADLKSNDQAKSAQYSLYTLVTGEVFVPLEAGRHLPTKPPLASWIGTLGFLVAGGPSEAALRVVTALEALLLVWMTVLIARRCLPPPGPLVAGLVLASNYIFLKTATNFRPDALLAALVALAVWLWLVALQDGRRLPGRLGFVALGLATLAKGPVAIVFGLSAVLPFALAHRGRYPLRRLGAGVGVLLFLGVVLAWAVPAFREGGRPLFDVLVAGEIRHHAGGDRQPIWTYLYAFPTRFLPWIVLFPFGVAAALRQRKTDPAWPLGLPLQWFAVAFVLLSLFGSKRSDYLLPVLPAAAILVAAGTPGLRTAGALAGLFLAGTGIAFLGFPERVAEPPVAREFVEKIRSATGPAEPTLVYRMGPYRNAVLFHLGSIGPPAKPGDILAEVETAGEAVVATTEEGGRQIAETGLEVREVLRQAPGFVLLRVRKKR